MKKLSIYIFILTTVLLLSHNHLQAQAKYGTSAAPFLGISIGPMGQAMGGSYVSYGRDATALYWNPGAISRTEKSQLYISNTDWFLDTQYNWMDVLVNLGHMGTLGLQMAYLDYGEEERTTVEDQDGTGERWSASDLFATISYARNLTDRFSMGG